jgi:DNA polymerase bacteriophage-type
MTSKLNPPEGPQPVPALSPVPRAIPELAASRDSDVPHVLHHDIETRSRRDLKSCGAWRYAADPSTEVLCVCYAADDEPVQLWTPGNPIPAEFVEAGANPNWVVVAHNSQFERAIEQHVLGPHHGWPQIPLERYCCTLAMAQAVALPGALEGAAGALGLSVQKDKAGAALMRQLCRPVRVDPTSGPVWLQDRERLARLYEYCRRDVEVERALYEKLPPLSADEQLLWRLDATINARGFHVDRALAEAARDLARKEQTAIDAEIAMLTNGAITTVNQVAKIADFVRERGHTLKSLNKRSVSAVLAHGPGDEVKRLLELRRVGARAAARKLDALLAGLDADDRLRGTLRYHGAATGRWSGRGFQPQNLKRPETDDIDGAINAVASGDLERVRKLGSPLAVIGDISRALIAAAPGHVMIAGDFTTIEARILSWLAGETSKLDVFRRYDATGDPALDCYLVTASQVLRRPVAPDDEAGRHVGKMCQLAFGFGGALGAWRRFDADGHTDAEVNGFVQRWRQSHPATTRFWRSLESAIRRTVRTGERGTLGSLAFEFADGTLRIVLPSGRCICYPEARLAPGKFEDTTQVTFKDNARGKWTDVSGWHGTFTENVVQGIARDLLVAAIWRVERAGYPIVLHVHDEIVCEVPAGFGSEARFLELMTELPEWAAGLPIAAKVRVGDRYAKSKPSSAEATPEATFTATTVDAETMTVAEIEKPAIAIEHDVAGETTIQAQESAVVPDGFRSLPPPETDGSPPRTGDGNDYTADAPPIGGPVEEPPMGNRRDNDHGNNRTSYGDHASEKHVGKPYAPTRARLRAQGYRLARTFPFTVPGETEPCFYEDRYELRPEIAPTKQRPRKTHRFHHIANGQELNGTGPRRIVYNWPAIMRAGRNATVHITEGANKSEALIERGMLATAAPYHQWGPECVDALAGCHLIYHEDHNPDGGHDPAPKFAADAKKHLAPRAASFRSVPAKHLWKHLPGGARAIRQGDDLKDWLELGGDPAKLLEICCEIPTDGARLVFINMSNWDSEPAPEQEWAVPDKIPRGQLALFSGEGAAGKSTEGLHLCAAHVLGRDCWLTSPEPGPAIFIDAEDGEGVIHRRLAAIIEHYDVRFAELVQNGLHLISLVGHDAVLATCNRNGKIEPTPLYSQLIQAAGDIKPIEMVIASSANVFAGSEIDRSQVQQFCGLLTRLALVADGSVVLISHPSLTGINTETGLSGSTQWHNAVRARFYMRGVKPADGEQPDQDLREIIFKKNQYGPVADQIVLRWQNGIYLPVVGMASLDQAARETKAEEIFLDLLRRFTRENRFVSTSPSRIYAPALFAREAEAKNEMIDSKTFEGVMRRLFKAGVIWNEPYGKPSRPSYRIALKT